MSDHPAPPAISAEMVKCPSNSYGQPPSFGDVPRRYAHHSFYGSKPPSFGDVPSGYAPRSFFGDMPPSFGDVPSRYGRSFYGSKPPSFSSYREYSSDGYYLSGKYHGFSLPPDVEAAQVYDQSKGNMTNLEHLKIPLRNIIWATENFSPAYRIGSGGFGSVYKAELDHFDNGNSSLLDGNHKGELLMKHSIVAIKRILSRYDKQGKDGFLTELESLSRCKHLNIVSLIGFCDEDSEKILVYEYVANGSLEYYLGTNNMTNLTWDKRIKICMDIAHGLKYLHTDMEGKPMTIHRDIKSSNILIDDNWRMKISDFGLSITSPVNTKANTLNTDVSPYNMGTTTIYTNVAGTSYYLDPEYRRTGRLKK